MRKIDLTTIADPRRRAKILRDRRNYQNNKPARHKSWQKWYRKNRTAKLARDRQYRKDHPIDKRAYHLKSVYGLSLKDYDALYKRHKGRCAICGVSVKHPSDPEATHSNMATVDHDHVTGKVRGILCKIHNIMLGLAGDDHEILKEAIKYLREFGREHTARRILEVLR